MFREVAVGERVTRVVPPDLHDETANPGHGFK